MGLPIKGQDKTDLINYPPYTATTIFLPSCNFRCPYCQNPDLVLRYSQIPDIPEETVLDFLDRRKKWLDGVCITGGEPTLHKELPGFIRKIKSKGYRVKLDTNGTNPRMVESLLKENLLDYIAMDIKAPKDKYESVAGAKTSTRDIEQSIVLIRNSGIGYEFRTTIVRELLSEKDMLGIAEWIKGSKKYVLQQFRRNAPVLDAGFSGTNYSPEELNIMKERLSPYFGKVEIRSNQ